MLRIRTSTRAIYSIDYQALNDITVKDKYLLTSDYEAFQPPHQTKICSYLDLRNA